MEPVGAAPAYRERMTWWRRAGYGDEEAARFAWGDTAAEWYRHHGILTPDHICAGCGDALSGTAVLLLPHGERAHADAYRCVIAYGRRWRSAAARALDAVGIATPAGALDLDDEKPSAAGGDLPPRAA